MHLTVLSVAFPFAPVSSAAVGGAEQILSTLDCALRRAGHVSLVVACEGSRPAGSLFQFPVPSGEVLAESDQIWCRNQVQRAIDRALNSHHVDLIHMHGLDFYEYTLPAEIPVLVTLHLPIAWYPADKLKRFHKSVYFCCVSESQRLSCPPELRNIFAVENGTHLLHFEECSKSDFALVLGRICP
ncbi:MAG TPA: glycosyltransferase, partial [Acidobacteriaceae bacterium]|nr:glycosyltransferase [Acidobacteriaceae bacterium]